MSDEPTPAPTPPVVEAILAPARTTDRDIRVRRASRTARAERRQKMFRIFFAHAPGALRAKLARAEAVIAETTEPDEFERLRGLLGRLHGIVQSCPPPDDERAP